LITKPVNSNEPSGFAASPAMAFYSWIQVATWDICLPADPTLFRVVRANVAKQRRHSVSLFLFIRPDFDRHDNLGPEQNGSYRERSRIQAFRLEDD
jgi:hypothetical protein